MLVVMCPLELKEALILAEPDAFFETDHYRGWPAMLVRLENIDDDRLRDRILCAWREKAPRKLTVRVISSQMESSDDSEITAIKGKLDSLRFNLNRNES